MSAPILEVRNLYKSYAAPVLNGVSFSVEPGQSVAIIGPSGSGKSTLLRCISSLEPFSSGEVIYAGVSIFDNGQPRTDLLGRQIGIVFQELHLWPNKTVLANVAEGPRSVLKHSRVVSRKVASDWLDRLGIVELAQKYPNELSGGQQQRVAIARTLALNPQLILMDEITNALDVQTVAKTLDLLGSLGDGQRSFVYITHHLRFAQDYTERTIVLIDGRVVEDGNSREVIQAPTSEAARSFLSVIQRTL